MTYDEFVAQAKNAAMKHYNANKGPDDLEMNLDRLRTYESEGIDTPQLKIVSLNSAYMPVDSRYIAVLHDGKMELVLNECERAYSSTYIPQA